MSAATASHTLESDATRIVFDQERGGAVVSVLDKTSKREFAPRKPVPPLLYELRFDGAPSLTEADAPDSSVNRIGNSIIITSRHSRATVECRFTVSGSLILGRISVRNDSGRPLTGVRFPALAWPGKPEDGFLLLPRNDGCLIRSPGNVGWLPSCSYPGTASLQLVAYYDNTGGLYVAAYDNRGFTKSFGVERRGDDLMLALWHWPSWTAGVHWHTDYDVAVATFRGDWQTAADIYKRWAVRQPWCRRTLAQRVADGDVPRWLVEPSLFYTFSLRGDSDGRLAQVPEQAAAWRGMLGAPVTMMLMGWEKLGPWVTPDYFPPFGGETAFRAATTALRAGGHHSLVFLSGLKWTLQKRGRSDAGWIDQTEQFEQRGAASAICSTNGLPQRWGKPEDDVGEYAQICAATPLAREILLGSALECQRLGIDCVQADQIVGGGLPPCYSFKHGHPPGGGNWCAMALYKLFDEIRREGKRRNPDFAWSIEEPAEFFIPVLDTYHARDYAQGRWPRDGAGVIGVPLFTHVYHEYLPGYGGDSCPVSSNFDPTILYQQGMNLVCGKATAVAVWGRNFDPRTTHSTQLRLLRSHIELWEGPAREFLVFGQRVSTPPLAVPTVRHRFFVRSGQPLRELDLPAVLHSVWKLPDGRRGAVFVCTAKDTVEFEWNNAKFRLQPGECIFVEQPK
ncbi:MAG: DUF6259 domain-containing protein [Verrucomicrobiae bacterium]|nr:DUF6259 domain-containing protein [Verrucomicrobiae bacterium]